jgi:hypothetical protein
MSNYDQWLEEPYQRKAEQDASIEKMVEDVLKEPEYDPTNIASFLYAIDDDVLHGVKEKLIQALNDPNPGFGKLGSVIYEAVYDYYYELAEKEAAHRYNQGFQDGGDY